MRAVCLLSLAALAGCNADIIVPTGHGDPFNYGDNDDGGGVADLAGIGYGSNADLADPCPDGQHFESGKCVPDEITCAEEFPCPMGQQCVGGRCIMTPGPCMTNNDCPTGNQCVNGMCVPVCPGNAMPQCKQDSDCGMNNVCVACICVPIDHCAKPTADLSGIPWKVHQDLHLDQALGAFGGTMANILKSIRDAILGCPNGGNTCFLLQFAVPFIPQWAQTLIVAVGNFADILDNHDFLVDSEMTFTHNGKPSGYDGVDHWEWLTFSYQGMQIHQKPENVMQIGKPVMIPFTASAICGVLYVDKHDVEGVLSGLLQWIVDTVVWISTNGMYQSLSAAIVGAIDCSQVGNLPAQLACDNFVNGLGQKIDDALNMWLLSYSLMTLQGTAIVTDAHHLDQGKWDGTLGSLGGIFNNFDGEWSATR